MQLPNLELPSLQNHKLNEPEFFINYPVSSIQIQQKKMDKILPSLCNFIKSSVLGKLLSQVCDTGFHFQVRQLAAQELKQYQFLAWVFLIIAKLCPEQDQVLTGHSPYPNEPQSKNKTKQNLTKTPKRLTRKVWDFRCFVVFLQGRANSINSKQGLHVNSQNLLFKFSD